MIACLIVQSFQQPQGMSPVLEAVAVPLLGASCLGGRLVRPGKASAVDATTAAKRHALMEGIVMLSSLASGSVAMPRKWLKGTFAETSVSFV